MIGGSSCSSNPPRQTHQSGGKLAFLLMESLGIAAIRHKPTRKPRKLDKLVGVGGDGIFDAHRFIPSLLFIPFSALYI
jgi:hypothetical protein